MEFPKMIMAQIFITHKCQLACKYCYENFKDSDDMSYETLIKVVDFITENAICENKMPNIAFFGGEPLIKFNDLIKPCVEYIRKRDTELNIITTISLTTNGLCLTEDIIKFFILNRVSFMLSFDGCEDAENATRYYKDGSSCFSTIDSIFDIITKYSPIFQVRMTADPANIKYLYKSILYLTDKNVDEVRVYPNVFTKWSEDDYVILNEQLKLLKDYFIKIFDNYDIPLIPNEFKSMFRYRVLKDYSEEHNLYRSIPACNRCNRCGGGFNGNMYVDTDGSIYTCSHIDFTPDDNNIFYLGNISDDIKINWDKVDNLLKLNLEKPIYSNDDCTKCPLDSICIGACTPNNYLVTGDFNKSTIPYCRWTKSIYNIMSDVAEYFDERQDNILFKDYFYGAVVNK